MTLMLDLKVLNLKLMVTYDSVVLKVSKVLLHMGLEGSLNLQSYDVVCVALCCTQGHTMLPWLGWNLPCRPGWPQTAGIKDVTTMPGHVRLFLFHSGVSGLENGFITSI